MPARVLVVDDSGFFRRRIEDILNADKHIEVVGYAVNGKDAIDKTASLKPDVITMDIEMPVMDGITAVRHIMKSHPTPILMFSSLTTKGAQSTLDALEAGAMDFLPKKMEDISLDRDEATRVLRARVRLLAAKGIKGFGRASTTMLPASRGQAARPAPVISGKSRSKGEYKLLTIGTSTGGPVALQDVLTKLPANFPVPILLIQHMPASFTPSFAERLDSLCKITVKEAEDGEQIKPGTAYLAPGGKQMELCRKGSMPFIQISESQPGQNYKPCVDVTFSSVANFFRGNVLALILTGMGADGREGARILKQGGSTIWAQDEESSIIYGMPAAIVDAGIADQVIPLSKIGSSLVQSI
ncbi:MAG: chemotaxis response regulator protein-glutamate methylesterase [Gammaproteobacteria bacterium]|nr:MAG: chemotaxis response regulator protein-glutamate methylesterase [Gammaproteobacteria bacterium]